MPIYPVQGARGITFQARWGRNPKNGQPFTKNFKLRREAKNWLETVGDKPYIPDRESLTIGAALDQWLEASAVMGTDNRKPVRPGTADGYKKSIKPLRTLTLKEGTLLTDLKLNKLTKATLMEIRDALLKAHTRDTASRAFNRLKSSLLEAMRRGQLLTDPIKGVAGIAVERGNAADDDEGEVEIYQPEQMQTLLATAYARSIADDGRTRIAWQRYRLLIETLVYTGMRPCEVRALARRFVLTDRRLIQVRRSADEKGRINAPKTPSSRRDIVIPQDLADRLAAYLATLPGDPDTLVFGNGQGKPESWGNITNRAWNPLVAAAGLPRLNPYSTRHFYASMLIRMGVREKRLTDAMGHRDVAFTMNIYGHLFQAERDQDVAVADRFGALLWRGPEKQPEEAPPGASQEYDTAMIRDNVTVMKSRD